MQATQSADPNPSTDLILGSDFEQEDAQVLRDLLREDSTVDLIIPEDINPDELWRSINVCCSAVRTMKGLTAKVKPLIGRMLIILEDFPEVIKVIQRPSGEIGYRNYNEFMSKGMDELFGISRSEAYYCRKIAQLFPSLTVQEFNQVGPAKLHDLVRALPGGDEDPHYEVLMKVAKEKTGEELSQCITEIKGQGEGERRLVTVPVVMTKDTAQHWKEFYKNKAIQAFCGADSPGGIIEFMMQYCSGEWMAQGEEILRHNRR